MLGFMSKEEAKSHGSYYGIPCWVRDSEDDFMVATKHVLLEPLFSLASWIEQFLRPIAFPGEPACFQFSVGRPI
ncbi:hypothetical protein [Herbaspirillum huttiense]|uniref:hypothetical protein n=1 Tax=Herbaspirillum huttiense TaxID=863372 RepID=UPI0031D7B7A7